MIEFLVAESETLVNFHKRDCTMYESCAVDWGTVSRWPERIKVSASRETELHDLPRPRRPATATRRDILNRADVIIVSERQITSQQLASLLYQSTRKSSSSSSHSF